MHGDVVALARVLLGVERDERTALCDRIFDKAHAADKYRKRFRRYHNELGDGQLASACHGLKLSPEPFLSDKNYADCLRIIFERVIVGPLTSPLRR